MDNEFIIINKLIEEKQTKYPNITHVWKKYIKLQKTQIEKILDSGIELFRNIEQIKDTDIDMQTILFLYLLHLNLHQDLPILSLEINY